MDDYNEVQSTSNADQSDRIPSHFLVELTSLDELAFPANSTKRVKYTCVASTSRSLILGTSTGTVYIFSRYAAKSRSRQQAPVPVHVFTTRDGQINTISLSSSEELMAIGGDSGRVSVAQMNNGQSPTLLYTIAGDARSPDKVTALGWSNDCKQVYSGHSSGNILVHRLGNRSVFRASHQKVTKFDGEITQLDVYKEHIIVSTTFAAFILHVESGTCQQIGKKARSSPSSLGACYIRPGEGSGYIMAARPNGRLWESNLVGVVYRTHQFRQNKYMPRSPPISFRSSFPMDSSEFEGIHPENQDVMFSSLKVMSSHDGKQYWILSAVGSRLCVVDSDSSKIIILSELENEIVDVSTCANDIFVLLADSKGLRKFTIFERTKAIEKLHLKSLFLQSGQLVSFCWPFFEFSSGVISKTIEGLSQMSKKKETEKLCQNLQKIFDEIEEKRKASESLYDNMKEQEEVSEKLSSGIHRVLRTAQESGYDDDFSFNTPQELRERSKSSPSKSVDELKQISPGKPANLIAKRASEPSNLEIKNEWRKNGTPDVVEEDILQRAKMILDSDGQKVVEKESLRTLLQLEGIKKDEIRFTPTVTIGTAAKALAELALAVPVDLSIIWKGLETKEDDDEDDSGLESTKTENKKNKPTIVKVVRPGVRPKPIVAVAARSIKLHTDFSNNGVSEADVQNRKENDEEKVSTEMRRKQDELWLDLRLSHLKQKNLENVKKSDTEDTLITDRSSVTPSGGVWTNPLNDSVTPTNTEKNEITATKKSGNCENCGMHRSWASLALLMTVCGRVEILKNEFENVGGLPTNCEQWEKLIHWKLDAESDREAICPRCETALSGVERVIADGWKTLLIVPDLTKPNNTKIYERCCQNISKEKMKNIISRNSSPAIESIVRPFTSTNSTLTNEALDSESVKHTISGKPENSVWNWLNAVNLKTVLAMAVFCEGKKNILDLLLKYEKWIANRMSNQDWCAMVVMSSREMFFKNLLSLKTIREILESVGADEWVQPKELISTNTVGSIRRSQSTPSTTPMSSWIVDTNSKCPLCSLCIKMVVGGIDRGFVTYSCGHVYHKMCLASKYSIGCLACRIRARRGAESARTTTRRTAVKS